MSERYNFLRIGFNSNLTPYSAKVKVIDESKTRDAIVGTARKLLEVENRNKKNKIKYPS